MKKAHIDNNNMLLGWYDTEIHSTIPTPNVEVTDAQWQSAIENNHNKVNSDGTTEYFDFRTIGEIFSAAIVTKKEELQSKFNADVTAISDALPHEMSSWRKQEEEARAYVANNTAATPFLSSLAASRGLGETVLDLANKVIANADAYQAAYSPLLGKYQALVNHVNSAATVADVEAIVW
jgi:hypothetical protein